MRTSFSSRADVAHIWAHQLQSEARYRDNFFMEGNSIYSYGHHYPCGTIVHNKDGKKIYILNNTHSSNTTAKHMSDVRMSIPYDGICFYSPDCKSPYCYDGRNGNYSEAVVFVLRQCSDIVEVLKRQNRARTRNYLINAIKHIRTINEWIQVWELGKKQKWSDNKIKPTIFQFVQSSKIYLFVQEQKLDNDSVACFNMLVKYGFLNGDVYYSQDRLVELMADWFGDSNKEELKAIQKKCDAATRRKQTLNVKQQIAKYKVKLDEWHDHQAYSWHVDSYDEWYNQYGWHTALRLSKNKDNVETSKGITLSLKEAKRLWVIVKGMENGADFRHCLAEDLNGSKWSFNNYKNHILTAGCHKIPFSECERIAKQLGW